MTDPISELAFLQSLTERELSELVLIPLLREMGFREIRYLHGRDEHGKDIVFVEESPLAGKRHYCATVKATELSGSVSTSRSIREVLYQVKQALQTPYRDPFDGRPVRVEKVFVITPSEISQAAITSIAEELQQPPASAVEFIDGPRLLAFLDQYLPTLLRSLPTEEGRYLSMLCQRFMELPTLTALGGDKGRTLKAIYTGGRLSAVDRNNARLLSFATPVQAEAGEYLGEVVSRSRCVVVLADVGAGKTTLLQEFVLQLSGITALRGAASLRQLVPIFIPLATLAPTSFVSERAFTSSIEELVRREAGIAQFQFKAVSRYILLLDGFDEINLRGVADDDNIDHATIAQYISKFAATNVAGIVVTSRPSRIPDLPAPFTYYALHGFSDDDVNAFTTKWFADAPTLRDALIERIRTTEELRLFCRTPLMLTLYCLLATRVSVTELPTRRSQIYDRMVDLLLGGWDTLRSVVNEFSAEVKGHILEILAYENHTSGQRQFSQSQFFDAAAAVLERRGEERTERYARYWPVLQEILFRSALVRSTDSTWGPYEFVHLSFQEFLAARRMTRIGFAEQDAKHLFEDWWRNAFRFYFGLTGTMDGTAFPKRRHIKGSGRVGLTLLEFLAEAEYTGLKTRYRVYSVLSQDLLYRHELHPAELEICRRVGDEIIDPLKQTVVARTFTGNAANYFRVLLALKSPRAQASLFNSEDVLTSLNADEVVWLLSSVTSLVRDRDGREFLKETVKVLQKRAHTVGAGLGFKDARQARRDLDAALANLEATLRDVAESDERDERRELLPLIQDVEEVRSSLR